MNEVATNEATANQPVVYGPTANRLAVNQPSTNRPGANQPSVNQPAVYGPTAIQPPAIQPAAIELEARRRFLFALGGLSATAWLSAGWGDIAAAAERAATQPTLEFFNTAEAADVDAMVAQIIPSGPTPGAREAHAMYFIDRGLATFFASRAAAFRAGLADFQRTFHKANPTADSFAVASSAAQIAFLTSVEKTEFFEVMRVLTIIGTLSAPRYGGNFSGTGWKMLGFEDQHVYSPPFGYYDRDYRADVS